MRPFIIRQLLPTILVLLPLFGAALVACALPPDARHDYLKRIKNSGMDWLILSLGAILFLVQISLSWKALRWKEHNFDESADRWLNHLAQAAEWFPLLGLLGTVAAILQTFNSINGPVVTPQEIIRKYAPAITATGSGLLMALLNILPTWIVSLGRDIIRSMAGNPEEEKWGYLK
ncbi:MotA/TolQ/ExbB proton channel family protein [Telmatocola sphagniphila]|uniref:MotA/TolQ/ExbB proton channel family protein n=1 Tax=Telmatocola sphagniphila TaxID=1123043 RepID=A0A8E6EU05_9BACT|nr:MotA/TolQ/ExbB proton channel family protein [Telmatocola sphagniphila]QVL33094.1 MotA/TolQ/ExbB proton channel family protein [Telmatocola sphagniphila]